jgi:hypothetical protein
MTPLLQFAFGAGLAIAGWLIPRRVAGAKISGVPALLLDLFPPLLGWGVVLATSGRPMLGGVVVLSLGAGLALFDRVKREALREPIVFSDLSELPQLFTHPHLYLPFAGTGLVLGGAAFAILSCLSLFAFEPEMWRPGPLLIAAPPAVLAAAIWVGVREPALGHIAAWLRRLGSSGEPNDDAARLGPFATLIVYQVIAAAERPFRRSHVASPAIVARQVAFPAPLVLVQCESFFDARRLSPLVPRDLLPGFDACRGAGATFGRLGVPGWGANTTRAEFAVLTGLSDEDLGLDRFNPYLAFARMPISSIAWRLRQEGYRTICLHPFDRRFFRRDLAIPALGFDTFLGRETIGGSRRPPYCSDPELAQRILETIDSAGPATFVFAITMGNHGPWFAAGEASRHPYGMPELPELQRYLARLRQSDEMIEILSAGLRRRENAMLGFYGDHLPSLPRAFSHFGFDEWSSDYLLWRNAPSPRRRLDLPAHRLAALILDHLGARAAASRTERLAGDC